MDKEIDGFPDCTVDECGIVKCRGKPLGAYSNGRGYMKVFLPTEGGKKKSLTVHRLVANAFIANPEGLPVVDHKDGDKLNNRADNLEWVSHQNNTARWLNKKAREKKPIARVQNGKIKDIFLSIAQAAKYKKVDYRGLYEAVKNSTKYKGSFWVYCQVDIQLEAQ